MKNKNFNNRRLMLLIVALMTVFVALGAVFVNAVTDTTRPTILSISPTNIQEDLSTNKQITAVFSEYMNPKTINADTFTVTQRTTPQSGAYRSSVVDGTVTYSDLTATFTPNNPLTPDQQYGNVFTVTITSGAQDLAGNSLTQDYMWSFTTGEDAFNTGTTTSQLDQSSATINEPVVVPVVTQPEVVAPIVTPVITPAASTNSFPWVYVVGIAFLILIITLAIISYTTRPVYQKNKVGSQASRPSPFGDVHPVMDLEGIGPKYSKGLNAMGIKNTKQLWNADAIKVAHRTGASIGLVKSWQHMAELASVKDIGPQYAELLERSGVHTISQLKNYNAVELLSIVREKEDSLKINIQGNTPGPALVENWIAEARDHRYTESEGQFA